MKPQPTQQTTGCIRSPHRHISFRKGQRGAVSEDVRPPAGKDRGCSSKSCLPQPWPGFVLGLLQEPGLWKPPHHPEQCGCQGTVSLRHCRNWVLGWVALTVMDNAPFPSLAMGSHVSSCPWQISCVVCPLQKGSSAIGILQKPEICV